MVSPRASTRRAVASVTLAVATVLFVGCAEPALLPAPETPTTTARTCEAGKTNDCDQGDVARSTRAAVTRSPWRASVDGPRDPSTERERALALVCGAPDDALSEVARELVERRVRGLGVTDPDAVVGMLRVRGEPHVRPRVVTASGRAPIADDVLRAQLETVRRRETRCGVAIRTSASGKELLVAVAIDALADLEPLRTRMRTGEWVALEARVRVPATEARVVLLGPRGTPRTVATTIDPATGVVRARFVLDQPGAFTVQLVADVARGPEPLLEARVFADVEPPSTEEPAPAPGEESGRGDQDEGALARMVDTLRTSEDLRPLQRDPRLDALAKAHAVEMARVQNVGHDVGAGDTRARFEAKSLAAKTLGENVARAASLESAHRALHASPSHRLNLLRADYTHIGLGVVSGPDGRLYVCEIFADKLH